MGMKIFRLEELLLFPLLLFVLGCVVTPTYGSCWLHSYNSRTKQQQQQQQLPPLISRTKLRVVCGVSKTLENDPSSLPVENPSSSNVCILQSKNKDYHELEQQLSQQLSLPILVESDFLSSAGKEEAAAASCTHILSIVPYQYEGLQDYAIGISGIERKTNTKKSKIVMTQPLFVDFCPPPSSRLGRRTSTSSNTNSKPDLLLKAIGSSSSSSSSSSSQEKKPVVIYDLTAGWGRDACLMARAGTANHVHMVERHPILVVLLRDAIRRLHVIAEQTQDADVVAAQLSKQLSVEQGDGRSVLQPWMSCMDHESTTTTTTTTTKTPPPPDVIYLDPMFPTRKKNALVKKDMQILHGLLDSQASNHYNQQREQEEYELLQSAIHVAQNRVVVKRPIHAPTLGSSSSSLDTTANDQKKKKKKKNDSTSSELPPPSYQILGSINRWDVYVKK